MKDLKNYKGDDMKKFFRIFLVFILFFNCLFFSISVESFAEDSIGAKDRLRSLINTGKKGIKYTYSVDTGFTCKPGGVLFYGESKKGDFNKCQSSKGGGILAGINCLNEIGPQVGAWAWDIVVDVLLAPVLCISTFYTVANFINSKSAFSSLLAPLLILLASSGMEMVSVMSVVSVSRPDERWESLRVAHQAESRNSGEAKSRRWKATDGVDGVDGTDGSERASSSILYCG